MATIAHVKPLVGQPRHYLPGKVVPIDRFRTDARGAIDVFSLEERLLYLKEYGNHCMSFSVLQHGMNYYDIPGVGFIAFKKKWGTRFVLADPVCEERHREMLIREFLKDGRSTSFIQISKPVAELIAEKFGFYATQFGIESVVELANWDLKGKKKQVMRTSINHAMKEGVVITERCSDSACKDLTREWMKTRKVRNREVSFLIRPMNQEFQDGTRKFSAYHNGELVGFIFFDPLYENGKVVSYVPNISRFSNKFKYGIFYPLMCHAMEVFKEEGVKYLDLGLCPMMVDIKDEPYESGIVKKIIRLLYNYGNAIYSFKGLYFTKSRFEGKEKPTFCAHKEKLPMKSFLTMFFLANII